PSRRTGSPPDRVHSSRLPHRRAARRISDRPRTYLTRSGTVRLPFPIAFLVPFWGTRDVTISAEGRVGRSRVGRSRGEETVIRVSFVEREDIRPESRVRRQ